MGDRDYGVKVPKPRKEYGYSATPNNAAIDGKPVHYEQVIKFVETPLGWLSLRQELWCWRYAWHANGMQASRETYNTTSENSENIRAYKLKRMAKIRDRMFKLQEMHKEGKIDLEAGPWKHYKLTGIGQMNPKHPHKHLTNKKMALA